MQADVVVEERRKARRPAAREEGAAAAGKAGPVREVAAKGAVGMLDVALLRAKWQRTQDAVDAVAVAVASAETTHRRSSSIPIRAIVGRTRRASKVRGDSSRIAFRC